MKRVSDTGRTSATLGDKLRVALSRTSVIYRRIFSHFDKLDVLYLRFITFALIHDTLRCVNTP